MRKQLFAAALVASLISSSASADLLQANFAGTTGVNQGFYPAAFGFGCPIVLSFGCTFASGTPFTATFVFNTSLGVLSSSSGTFDLTGGLVSDILTVTGVGSFSNSGSDLNLLEWQVNGRGNLVPIDALARDSGGFRQIAFLVRRRLPVRNLSGTTVLHPVRHFQQLNRPLLCFCSRTNRRCRIAGRSSGERRSARLVATESEKRYILKPGVGQFE